MDKQSPTLIKVIRDLNFVLIFLMILSFFPVPEFIEDLGISISQNHRKSYYIITKDMILTLAPALIVDIGVNFWDIRVICQ